MLNAYRNDFFDVSWTRNGSYKKAARVERYCFLNPRLRRIGLAASLLVLTGFVGLAVLADTPTSLVAGYLLIAPGLIVLAGITTFARVWLRAAIRKHIPYLLSEDECPECDHDLRGLPLQMEEDEFSIRCPECGWSGLVEAQGPFGAETRVRSA